MKQTYGQGKRQAHTFEKDLMLGGYADKIKQKRWRKYSKNL